MVPTASNVCSELQKFFSNPQNSLSDEKALIFSILDSIHESILIIDTHTRILFVNQSYMDMFHISKEKIIGHHLNNFEPLARICTVLKTQTPITGDISHIHSAKMDVCADMVPLFSGGTLIGAMALMRDVTELTNMSRDLEHFKALAKHLKNEIGSKDDLPQPFHSVIGQDANFVNILHIAARAAVSDASICIIGDSGTGKEVLSEAIHLSSNRATGPLIKINCAAIPDNLLESELFGYESGSFTGARAGGKPGKFELAAGGTIFLDEIGEMPISMQVKLLRVLQEKKVERIGGTKSIPVDFRLITATNRNLEDMIAKGSFREDLYYRINVIGLNIPPLRERPGDIEIFARIFLDDLCQKYHRELRFTPEAIFALTNYDWPGNVRELKNYVERAAILSLDDELDTDCLPTNVRNSRYNIDAKTDRTLKLHELLENTEHQAILHALTLSGGNKSKAIELLGISRRSFYQKLTKYNIAFTPEEA